MDLSSLLSAVDLTTVTTAIIGLGALKMLPTVARWATSRVVGMFGR